MARHLPEPELLDHPNHCLRCGYDIETLAAPGHCPECGLFYMSQAVALCGTVQTARAATPLWRKLLWAFVIIDAIVISQGFGVMLFIVRAYALFLGAVVALIGAVTLLLLTGKGSASSDVERLIFVPGGVGRTRFKQSDDIGETNRFIEFEGPVQIELKPVSDVWARVRVRRVNPNGTVGARLLDAGVRCPKAIRGEVRGALQRAADGSGPAPEHPPTAPPTAPPTSPPADSERAQANGA